MAIRANDPATRAGTIAFVSKLARDSDTHAEVTSKPPSLRPVTWNPKPLIPTHP